MGYIPRSLLNQRNCPSFLQSSCRRDSVTAKLGQWAHALDINNASTALFRVFWASILRPCQKGRHSYSTTSKRLDFVSFVAKVPRRAEYTQGWRKPRNPLFFRDSTWDTRTGYGNRGQFQPVSPSRPPLSASTPVSSRTQETIPSLATARGSMSYPTNHRGLVGMCLIIVPPVKRTRQQISFLCIHPMQTSSPNAGQNDSGFEMPDGLAVSR